MNESTGYDFTHRGRADGMAVAASREGDCPVVTGQQPLILVVDDDQNTREALATLLELDGYRVATASDGREALDLLEGGLQPALIVLDMNMPRMDGLAFRDAQRRRPAFAAIPVIVCSGCVEHEERMAAMGSVVFLRKPMSVDLLQTAVHQQCPL